MDYFLLLLLILNLTVVTINQSNQAAEKVSSLQTSQSERLEKADRIFLPPPNSASLKGALSGTALDPIQASYNRLPFPGDQNLPLRPGDVRIPPTGNFPGDQPPPGIPIQPGQNIDRRFPGVIGDNCLFKLRFYMASCEDALLQRQRDARNARTAPDIQRRMCCSLYYYYDCLSKLVIQYCRDASPMVVNLVMPENRRREMAINCRTYTRDQCNSSNNIYLNHNFLLLLFVITLFVNIKLITF